MLLRLLLSNLSYSNSAGLYYLPLSNSPYPHWLCLLVNILSLHSFLPIPSFFFSFNAVTWSISAELAFYLVFPFLIALSTRKILAFFFCNILLIFIFAFVLSILQVPSYSTLTVDQPVWEGFVYINPIFRLPEFVVGIIAAKLKLSGHFDCCLNQFYYKFHRIRIKSSLLWLFSFALFYWLGFQSFSLDDSIYQPLQASLIRLSLQSLRFVILLLTSAPQLIAFSLFPHLYFLIY